MPLLSSPSNIYVLLLFLTDPSIAEALLSHDPNKLYRFIVYMHKSHLIKKRFSLSVDAKTLNKRAVLYTDLKKTAFRISFRSFQN